MDQPLGIYVGFVATFFFAFFAGAGVDVGVAEVSGVIDSVVVSDVVVVSSVVVSSVVVVASVVVSYVVVVSSTVVVSDSEGSVSSSWFLLIRIPKISHAVNENSTEAAKATVNSLFFIFRSLSPHKEH